MELIKNILIIGCKCKLYIKSQKSVTYILPNYFFKSIKKVSGDYFWKKTTYQ